MKQSHLAPSTEVVEMHKEEIKIKTVRILNRIDQAATMLEISARQVRNLVDSGDLEGVPIGSALEPSAKRRHIRITTRSIELFINRRRRAM